mmetsp:Transcript_15208/g.45140  ORF Transcript_15208/g.45140 Transcript_15208/m.45140 type:complete len:536 (+) Transcript_15208:27-1634(+)
MLLLPACSLAALIAPRARAVCSLGDATTPSARLAAHLEQLQAQKRAAVAVPAVREQDLCERVGISSFKPFQRTVLQHLGALPPDPLEGGSAARPSGRTDVLAVQPTGAGKSVCFQAAAAALGGTTLVISPLVSLMFDQVTSASTSLIRSATINSMQSPAERAEVMEKLSSGQLDLLYTSPEQLDRNGMLARALQSLSVPLVAVDEAHCISSWGHDFRPAYRRVLSAVHKLGSPRLLALTASAPPAVRDDIARQLGFTEGHLRIVASCYRSNIRLLRGAKSVDAVTEAVAGGGGPALVYAQTRKEVRDLAVELSRRTADGGGLVYQYHAGMKAGDRAAAQERFMGSREGAVMVATSAFGMGLNKANIRTVVHFGAPGTIESYYQELGRGGRDGKPSRAVLLCSDLAVHRFFLETVHPTADDVSRVWRAVLTLGSDAEEQSGGRGRGRGGAATAEHVTGQRASAGAPLSARHVRVWTELRLGRRRLGRRRGGHGRRAHCGRRRCRSPRLLVRGAGGRRRRRRRRQLPLLRPRLCHGR